ncbi:TonB-dependent receptor [Sphingomonas sp. BIUV-7]|uniref:TonB-dependent receptor n=1 Tax=Sphingomonas natans TaxID=3063330 RepID=A0ABT8Y7B0_9SPHN|nr:TonB-dependent receptor [Sphingomonas sp. BIUV-7]MDO6414186.1 TonB-dependent receptor [Sphingomonas sp. BIUV-7]
MTDTRSDPQRQLALRVMLLASMVGVTAPLIAQTVDNAQSPGAAASSPVEGSIKSSSVQPNPVAEPETAAMPAQGVATTANASKEDEIIISGARATQRSSLETKRSAAVILDGIVNDQIGALPDNSVGDTLTRITGVTSDRFKGNANEISVRGLGPTLSFATFNGREVSSAGADRSVAFQQFPSELVNGVLVYKSQEADFVEGGSAGIIDLRSLKPLDYGKRRIVAEVRGAYSPQENDNLGRTGASYRANLSYTDQFETGIGDIGVSIGYQRQDTTAPEDYYTTNSAFVPCTTSANAPGTSATNCSNAVTAPTGSTVGGRYFATSSRAWRANVTNEKRDALIGALEWKPTSELDISLDGQYSKRRSLERRFIFSITEATRGIQPQIIGGVGNDDSAGALLRYAGNSNLETQNERRQRNETYVGGGGTVNWKHDQLTLVADASYSGSHRTETQKATRLRSNTRVAYVFDNTRDAVPSVSFGNFNINDPANYTLAGYARNRLATNRRDKIYAGRVDGSYDLDGDFLQSLKVGGRYSSHRRTNDNAANTDLDTIAPALSVAGNQQCRTSFPTNDFMHDSKTNISSWATFDNDCLYRTFTGGSEGLPFPTETRDPSDINVRERIWAGYAMANFRSQVGDVPVSGNAGVRYVRTTIDSKGFNVPVSVVIDPNSGLFVVNPVAGATVVESTQKGRYAYWLPSANIAFDVSEKVKLRLAGYRSLSRSGIESFGAGVAIGAASSTATTVQDALANSTTGNPALKPLMGWNADVSMELYLNKDTSFSLAPYYKWLKGAVIARSAPRSTTLVVNGAPITISSIAPINDDTTRRLYGLEVSGSHQLAWLPAPLDGFGVSGGFNYVHANFAYPDPSTLAPYVEPANLIGSSKYNANASIWWEKYGFSIRGFYRYRSNYYKPNSSTNRSVRGSDFLDVSVQYNINDHVQLKAQAQNITGTRDIFFKGGYDSVTEVSASGPTYYAGVRVVF